MSIVAANSYQIDGLLDHIGKVLDDQEPILETDHYEIDCRCLDCDYVLFDRWTAISERYMVHDHIWAETGLGPDDGELCIRCIERRLGRGLCSKDFTTCLLNWKHSHTERLKNRLYRKEPMHFTLRGHS